MENTARKTLAYIIGSRTDSFIRDVSALFGDYEVDCCCCEDIYQAACKLAKADSAKIIIIGRFSQLNKENSRFLQKVKEKRFQLCCFADTDIAAKQLSENHPAAFIISKTTDMADILEKMLTAKTVLPETKKQETKPSAFIKNDFAATKAELDALLEV